MRYATLSSSTFFVNTDPTIALADVTRHSLYDFRRRRLLLRQCRGLGWTLLLVVGILLLATLVDSLWANPVAQLSGSVAVYAILAVAGLRLWRARRQHADLHAEARRFEKLDTRLRERLLSAVELSEHASQVVDSAAFRNQLQQQVARLISAVEVRQLLPWSSVQRPIGIGLGACTTVLLLCMIPNLHLPQRMARIVLPMFDWGRVGRIAITLERPMPHSKTVPRDDIVAVTARSVGPSPATLQLEARLPDGTVRVIDMQPINTHTGWSGRNHSNSIAHYEGLLPADAAQIDYRVQGEAASTPWYRLTTLPRSEVVEQRQQLQTEKSSDGLPQTDVGSERTFQQAVERSASASDAGLAAESDSKQTSSTLADAAGRLSEAHSRARQPPQPAGSNPSANPTAGSRSTNIQPQPSATARVLSVERGGGEWGQLPEQAVDDLLETRRDSLIPRYQKQVDAYFRELAELGRE